ncbi:RNI-like protein [Microthyrium microscopicum]|uniref:RNI-like protein n=1 Tax=Microthyrium microscopicum TaxID=703497 RepID=A0A6A6TZC6_9PEZI|nr:RNI-like protein [Microthyrium microscopicum]
MVERQPRSQNRRLSNSQYASSASTSPERGPDDDNDSFMLQQNDSVSSLACSDFDELSDSMLREMEERCRLSPISRLPAELMIAIFQKLPKTSDLKNCMMVSREWARNSVGLLWHRPATGSWEAIHSVSQTLHNTQTTFDYDHLVKRLNLSSLGPHVSDGTLLPFRSCKRIERLTLTNCSKLTDFSVAKVIDGNRSLAALDVTGIDGITDITMDAVAQNCYRLQGLNITNCLRISNEKLEAIATSCRHLKRLKFNGCAQITDKSVIAFARNCRQLLEIDLADCRRLENDAVTALISEGMHLRELRLTHCQQISDTAFSNLPYGATYESLRILDLTGCVELQDAGVHRIIEAAPRLRNLVLAKCRQITDRAITAITKLGKSLHFIHLGHCARITDAGVIQLVRLCNRIRYIDLACCTNLTDHSVTQLATLPKLKRIGLVKCGNITDVSIYALSKPRQPGMQPVSPGSGTPSSLERVHLSYCINLTLDGITSLLNNCPRLSHLSLTGVQEFLRDDLLHFCRPAPREFTEHQRNFFCVFSGNNVARLKEYLLEQQENAQNIDPDLQATQFGGPTMLIPPPPAVSGPLPQPTHIPPPPPAPPAPPALPIHQNMGNLAILPMGQPGSTLVPGLRQNSLPRLRIPPARELGPNGTPPSMSPTNDAPLSVDEGEEFIDFPEIEPAPQPDREGGRSIQRRRSIR